MLQDIEADGGDVDKYVKMAKDPNNPFKLSGFGHRVVQELRPARPHPQGDVRRAARRARPSRPPARPRARARGGRAERRVLHRAQALPERRLLLRAHLPRDGLPHADVHGAVRDRPPSRVDRALERDDREPGHQDRPPPPDLRRPHQAPLRPHRRTRLTPTQLTPGLGLQPRRFGVDNAVICTRF